MLLASLLSVSRSRVWHVGTSSGPGLCERKRAGGYFRFRPIQTLTLIAHTVNPHATSRSSHIGHFDSWIMPYPYPCDLCAVVCHPTSQPFLDHVKRRPNFSHGASSVRIVAMASLPDQPPSPSRRATTVTSSSTWRR